MIFCYLNYWKINFCQKCSFLSSEASPPLIIILSKIISNVPQVCKTYWNMVSIHVLVTMQILTFNFKLYQWIFKILNRPSSLIRCLLTIATECGVGPVTSRVLRGLWTIILKTCYDSSCTWIYGIYIKLQ